jgi:hypothetical protein
VQDVLVGPRRLASDVLQDEGVHGPETLRRRPVRS